MKNLFEGGSLDSGSSDISSLDTPQVGFHKLTDQDRRKLIMQRALKGQIKDMMTLRKRSLMLQDAFAKKEDRKSIILDKISNSSLNNDEADGPKKMNSRRMEFE
jgi:hypothetical protein